MNLRLVRYIWIAFSLVVLVGSGSVVFFPLRGADSPTAGADLLVYYGMGVLSFPAGILGMVAFNLSVMFLPQLPGVWYLGGLWLSMFFAGYLQWFYFLPEVVRRIRRARSSRGASRS
jgi:hypothetical protein